MHCHFFRLVLVATAVLLAGCSAESRKARALERAGAYYRTGDFERAQIEYQNVLQKFPDDRTANERLALIWFERGATIRALAYLSKMYTLSPDNLELRLKRAQLIASLGHVAEPRREALAILSRSASVSEALVLLTECVRDAEDFKAADDFLQKFSEKNTVSFQIASANLLMLRGDAAKAKAALQRAIAIDSKSAAAHSALATFHAAQNNPEQALAEHKTAVELAPMRSAVRLKRAGYLAQTGAVAEAIATLTEMTRQVPDYLPAWRALAQIALAEKRHADALALAEKILVRDSADYETQILRARVWLAMGDTKKAITELERLGQAYQGLGVEKYHLALAYLQNNDAANAIVALQQTVGQFPDNIEAALMLAQLQLRAGTPEPVVPAMVALINQRPTLLQPYLLLIEAAKALGKLDDIVRGFSGSLEKEPRNAQLHYLLGLVYGLQEKPAEARQSFERALEVSPEAVPAIMELVNLDLREGKTAAALARAQGLVAKAPKLAAGHFLLARAHAAQGQWNEVETAAVAAIELDANQVGAYGLLADSFTARKDQPEVIARLEAFLAKRPADLRAVLLAGQVFTQMNQFSKARDGYEKYLAANPNAAVVLNNLANLQADQLNQLDRGLELARKAREADPGSPAIADTLGWILYRKKDYKEALPFLEECVRKLPGNPEAQFHLGMVQRALGNNEAALVAFKLADEAPGNFSGKEELKRQLAELKSGAAPASTPVGEKPKRK
jgi:tetratricopeptide (TPR) repeat protein